MNRNTVSRAFTCYQVLSLLVITPAIQVPFVLNLPNMFYDESVQIRERNRLLQNCITHLERLEQSVGGVVSVHLPRVPSHADFELLGLFQVSAVDTFYIQPQVPAPEPMRLF